MALAIVVQVMKVKVEGGRVDGVGGWGEGGVWVGQGNWRFADFYPINISDPNVGQGWVGRSYESCGQHQRLCGAAFVPLQRSIAKMGEIRLAQLHTGQPAAEMQAPLCIRSLGRRFNSCRRTTADSERHGRVGYGNVHF